MRLGLSLGELETEGFPVGMPLGSLLRVGSKLGLWLGLLEMLGSRLGPSLGALLIEGCSDGTRVFGEIMPGSTTTICGMNNHGSEKCNRCKKE